VRSRPRAARAVPGAVVAALTALALALLVAAALGRDTGEPGPPIGAVLDEADRRALGAQPIRRGPPVAATDPAVDLADPTAVARAYLAAARSADAGDRDRTRRQAAGYAEPGSPPEEVGVVVLDAPPQGQARRATVTELDLVTANDAGVRRGYRATVQTVTGPIGGPAVTGSATAYVVLARQPDGRWLVTADGAPTAGDD